jgi:uncharacterized protein (DUF58 family)
MYQKLDEAREFKHLTLLAKKEVEGFITGLHKSPFKGFSVEFAEHKAYVTGASTRNIDWKLFARTDKLYTKEYDAETNLRCVLAVDVSGSMFYPNQGDKLKYATFSALALSHMLKGQQDAFGGVIFSDQIVDKTPIKSTKSNLVQLEQLLYKASTQLDRNKSDLSKCIHELSEIVHKRSLIVIFSDMLNTTAEQEELFSALLHLRHNKHDVLLFHVHDAQTEHAFNFDDRMHEFVDLESGEKVRINPSEIKDQVAPLLAEKVKEIEIKCGMAGIDYIEIDINQPLEQVLVPFLKRRQKRS